MTAESIIRTIELGRVYRTEEMETSAVHQINLSVQEREFVAIMGPSGSGKTTLLNLLGLLDRPTTGQYYFLGQEVTQFNERQRALIRRGNIGFVFQSFNLIDELTVFENVALPMKYLKIAHRETRRRVMAALERMNMSSRTNHYPAQLSGGQQQRAAVARAIVTNPRVILADEPTGNLDSTHGDEVMRLLQGLNEAGTTIIMVTHSPNYAAFGHRKVELFDGRVADGRP